MNASPVSDCPLIRAPAVCPTILKLTMVPSATEFPLQSLTVAATTVVAVGVGGAA
jgi:hypothetical protein